MKEFSELNRVELLAARKAITMQKMNYLENDYNDENIDEELFSKMWNRNIELINMINEDISISEKPYFNKKTEYFTNKMSDMSELGQYLDNEAMDVGY